MIDKSPRFKDKIILVTGGTSGIGLATAVAFANNGAAKVIVCGRRQSKWEDAKEYIQKHLSQTLHDCLQFMPCDVRVESDVAKLIKAIFDQYNRLDVCFNNAGVQPGIVIGPDSGFVGDLQFESMVAEDGAILYRIPPPQPNSAEKYQQDKRASNQETSASPFSEAEIATSCIGIFYCLKWQAHYIFERQPKNLPVAIISTASRNGVLPDAHRALYAASKAFIITISKSIANQLAQKCLREKRQMVRVNTISPGPVDTPLEFAAYGISGEDKAHYADYVKAAATGVPMQRTAKAEEIAPTVLFLADENASSYVTASNICVDGGHTGSPLLKA